VRQLEALYASRAGEVPQNGSNLGLGLRIPSRGSPPLFSAGPPSPASTTQSEPIYLKTEEQDDIDQIIAPTRHLHVRFPQLCPSGFDNLTNFVYLVLARR
jgi:hypothetical protein